MLVANRMEKIKVVLSYYSEIERISQTKGYSGKLLQVDLSSGEIRNESLDEGVIRLYLGGRRLAALLLYDELGPGLDPCGEKNKLVIATGLLTGTPDSVGNRTLIESKSPLTGIWVDSVFGGSFGGGLKKAGFGKISKVFDTRIFWSLLGRY